VGFERLSAPRHGPYAVALGAGHGKGVRVDRIGLTETIDALRTELSEAVKKAADKDIQFPVGEIEIEFHVGVTRDADAHAGIKFWIVDLGASVGSTTEAVQRVTIKLEPPVDRDGNRIRVARGSDDKP
jgi:hypothetical protein